MLQGQHCWRSPNLGQGILTDCMVWLYGVTWEVYTAHLFCSAHTVEQQWQACLQGRFELARWHSAGAPAELLSASWAVSHDHGPQWQRQVLPLPCPCWPLAPSGASSPPFPSPPFPSPPPFPPICSLKVYALRSCCFSCMHHLTS